MARAHGSEYDDIPTLVKRANDLFVQRFKYEATVFVCSPGRVNLIGGKWSISKQCQVSEKPSICQLRYFYMKLNNL